jgi:flagellum-specific ATP synthase
VADLTALRDVRPWRVAGSVSRVVGHEIEIRGLRLRIGEALVVETRSGDLAAEVVALTPEGGRALVLGDITGIGKADSVRLAESGAGAVVGEGMLGRVVDALGRPLDGLPMWSGERVRIDAPAPPALSRARVADPIGVGVRVLDTFVTTGRGQRIGVFAGSGVGKSTLLGMMARGTTADVNVVALIGERGREVRDFLEDDLGPEAMQRTVCVVATSDQPPLVRLRAGFLATAIAEWFADRGGDVLLMLDSLTRLAMAQREVGLAAGEPPTARGYTPSVFSMLPRLLERAGPRERGTITAFYTVLVEGDDMNEPVADTARSILDGHIVLDRRLAIGGRYPAIDPLASLSRLAAKVTTRAQQEALSSVRAAMAAADEVRDLVEVGAYVRGANRLADAGLDLMPEVLSFLKQDVHEQTSYDDAWTRIGELAARVGTLQAQAVGQ